MLVWCDLETTGLNPREDRVLEVAFIVTDDDLNILGEPYQREVYPFPPMAFTDLDPFVQAMHTKNKLLDDIIYGGNAVTPEQASREICEHLSNILGDDRPPLCGSTVSFDRAFLQEHIPDALKYVSHRHVDVSSIKELARRWRPEIEPEKKDDAHRAIPDILASINLLKHYRNKGFIG